jgi:hypothetical protein
MMDVARRTEVPIRDSGMVSIIDAYPAILSKPIEVGYIYLWRRTIPVQWEARAAVRRRLLLRW